MSDIDPDDLLQDSENSDIEGNSDNVQIRQHSVEPHDIPIPIDNDNIEQLPEEASNPPIDEQMAIQIEGLKNELARKEKEWKAEKAEKETLKRQLGEIMKEFKKFKEDAERLDNERPSTYNSRDNLQINDQKSHADCGTFHDLNEVKTIPPLPFDTWKESFTSLSPYLAILT